MPAPAARRTQIPRDTFFFFFFIGGPFLYNMVLVSAIHQHGSALCETCPPSTTSLPSRLSQSPCVSSVSHMAHPPWSVLHVLVCTFPCYSLHSSHLSLPSESTSLLFMRDTQSASPWAEWSPCGREPKGDAQGVRIETDSSPAPECGFSPSQPPSGVSLFIESPSSPPSWEQAPGTSCLLGASGSLGTVSSRSCHHLQALGGIDLGQSSHSDGEQILL